MIDLKSIGKNKSGKNYRMILYGTEGIGKTTFCAKLNKAVIMPTEDGLGNNAVDCFPLVETFEEAQDHIESLYEQDHKWKTLVIDSLDWLEDLIHRHLCKKHKQPSIMSNKGEFGYGRGYLLATDCLKSFLMGLDQLRNNKNMNIVFTAHSQIKRMDDPLTEAYDRYCLKLDKKATSISMEWADIIAFATMQLTVKKEEVGFEQKKSRAVEIGDRILHLSKTPGFDAKNRFSFPPSIPFDITEFNKLFEVKK